MGISEVKTVVLRHWTQRMKVEAISEERNPNGNPTLHRSG